jgi:sporulation protein YlmC with PRC-barrel domain
MKSIRILTCASLLAGLAPYVAAQATPTTEKPKTTTVETSTVKFVRANDCIGKSLATPRGENLGKIEELVVHPKGDLAFVVISPDGSLKAGQKLIPIPWSAITHDATGRLTFDIKPDTFAGAPGFDKDNWHDLTDVEWWKDVDKRYGRQKTTSSAVEAGASLAPTKQLFRASELKAQPIVSPEGAKIASMHEIVFDPRGNRIAFAVLSVGGLLGSGEKMVAVPWTTVEFKPSKDNPKMTSLMLAATKEQIESAPEFVATSEGWEKANDPDYLVRVYEHYSVPVYWKVEAKPVEKK